MKEAILPPELVQRVDQGQVVYAMSNQHWIAVVATRYNVRADSRGRYIVPAVPKAWMDGQKHV